jgi:hypothetical protein
MDMTAFFFFVKYSCTTRPYAPYVLRGSPETTGKLADSLGFSKKYSSAVIAFHPTDSPTDTEIQEVLDGFEKVAFSGLKSDQYTYTAVLHKEKESPEPDPEPRDKNLMCIVRTTFVR